MVKKIVIRARHAPKAVDLLRKSRHAHPCHALDVFGVWEGFPEKTFRPKLKQKHSHRKEE